MSNFIKYQLEEDTYILVEIDESEIRGMTKASRDKTGNVISIANKKFENAFIGVKKSAIILREQLRDLNADEIIVTFGLKAIGEASVFSIAKAGIEANYTVTLKWSNKK